MFADRLSPQIRAFVAEALPLAHWGETYFDIRLKELMLADSLFGGVITRGGARALDIGCGIGLAAVFLADYFAAVEGTDIDEIGVAFSVDCPAPLAGIEILERLDISTVSLHCGDTFDYLRRRSESYDFIFSCFVFEHVEALQALIDGAVAALKPGGKMLHIVPNTHDTMIQLLLRNLEPFWQNVRKAFAVRKVTGRTEGKLLGSMFTPITHSEFVSDYRVQFEVNSLEHYVFPMIEAGLRVIDIKPMREHSYGILVEKPANA